MNRKPLIIAISFVTILLGVIIVLFFSLFRDEGKRVEQYDPDNNSAYNAVPSDAVMLIHFDSSSLLDKVLFDEESGISDLFNKEAPLVRVVKGFNGRETLFSMHYSDKDEVSLLFVQAISGRDPEVLLRDLFAKFPQSGEKLYGSTLIYRCMQGEVFVSISRGFLIASTSQILVESSLRHLDNAISIVDNKDFRSVLGQSNGDISLIINYRQIGKFFSGAINRPYLKYADFFSKYTSWSCVNYKYSSGGLKGDGVLSNVKKEENYSSIFAGKKPVESQIYSVAPYSSNFAFSVNIDSPKEFRKEYMIYLEANKQKKDYDYILARMKPEEEGKLSPVAWFEGLNVKEIGVVSLPVESGDESVVLLRSVGKERSLGQGDILPFEYKGYLPALVGSWFGATSEDFCMTLADWLIIGSEGALEYFSDMYGDGSFTMSHYMSQLSFYDVLKGESNLSFAINMNSSSAALEKIFKREFVAHVLGGLAINNVSFFTYSLSSSKKELKYATELRVESVDRLPQPNYFSKDGELIESLASMAKLVLPKGPFEVKNFVNGRINYLEQQPNNMIRLLDENRKGVWTIPFEYPICGYVEQVDHYKNGKLQMVFGAGDKVYMLDRLGRFVRSYPVSVGKNIVLGPKVWDFNGDRGYSLMILHDDNTIGLYDMKGEKWQGWSDIVTQEQIISLPERHRVGEVYYWVLRTPVQTLIYDPLGSIVADFSRRNIIAPDTEIEIVSSKELKLRTIDGRQVVLNLEKGSFKRV